MIRPLAPRTRKAARTIFVMRAIMASRPGREKRTLKRALKDFRRLHPKGSISWATI